MKKIKCITCNKKLEEKDALVKYEVYFCDTVCVVEYEKKLKEMETVTNWDDCC